MAHSPIKFITDIWEQTHWLSWKSPSLTYLSGFHQICLCVGYHLPTHFHICTIFPILALPSVPQIRTSMVTNHLSWPRRIHQKFEVEEKNRKTRSWPQIFLPILETSWKRIRSKRDDKLGSYWLSSKQHPNIRICLNILPQESI